MVEEISVLSEFAIEVLIKSPISFLSEFEDLFAEQNEILEIYATDHSILIVHTGHLALGDLRSQIMDLKFSKLPKEIHRSELVFPICYDEEFGYDLPKVCTQLGIERQDFIKKHTSVTYPVGMMGFIPGFAYLDGLPAELKLPRKESPSKRVPANSVAIAAERCAIYPSEVSGGWHIIGRTPMKILDWSKRDPFTIKEFHDVRFRSISKKEFQELVND